MKAINFLLTGVGGQGTLLASNVIAEVGLSNGYDAKKAEVHGMSQRGGSVVSHVRWGKEVFSPLISEGEADVLIAFEKLETVRFIDWLRPDGLVIVNNYCIIPLSVTTSGSIYPQDEELNALITQRSKKVHWINGIEIAEKLENTKVANMVILGALSFLLDMKAEEWLNVIQRYVPPMTLDINIQAFNAGRQITI
jgi:indolepyruvate ferredoxin oxidoreductase beta subunit